ncbi:hypothetical protein FQN54_005704 [Arachnomyces sp. PD_36]|nr:hypothetical protein FQN54_005704 [Arachnomyces sp. PD_36]
MAGANSAVSDYFNDLLQQPSPSGFSSSRPRHSPDQPVSGPQQARTGNTQNEEDNAQVPRPKRIACVICRKRKLRCDGKKPSCGTCSRLGHDCAYDEVRRKSGPKRGYVKQLEARLAQVETLLKTQEPSRPAKAPSPEAPPPNDPQDPNGPFHGVPDLPMFPDGMEDVTSLPLDNPFGDSQQTMPSLTDPSLGFGGDFSWEMIGLGLEEPLPSQDVIDELHQIYFEKIHPSIPIIHRPRYLAAMNLAPSMRPPVCLRYIMWCHAACITDKYAPLQKLFYQRARKYMEMDTIKGQGESMVTVAHAQCWILFSNYEFKQISFPRAWMSAGSSVRLANMMGLHRQDNLTPEVKQPIPAPRDWTEKEERRRTFWMAFCQDRYASIGTGWPMLIDEKDILTNLPSSEDAFLNGIEQKTKTLSEVMDGPCNPKVDSCSGSDGSNLSSFAGIVLMACLFGRNLTHLHHPEPSNDDHDLNGEFWKRHRALDNILLGTSLSLPEHLRLPFGVGDPNTVFLNMNIHTSAICLHQAAIFKADKHQLSRQIVTDSKRRCIVAANQITNAMKMISHSDLTAMNPFTAFCLYVAARVFIQYLKARPSDETVLSSLRFLLSAMNTIKAKNPLTESFLNQIEVDLEGAGLRGPGNAKDAIRFPYGHYGLQRGVLETPPDDDADDYQAQNKCGYPMMPPSDPGQLGRDNPSDKNGRPAERSGSIEPLFPCPTPLPTRSKREDPGICPFTGGPSVMTLPGMMPPLSDFSANRDHDFLVSGMMDTGTSSGVSTNSDRQPVHSDQATPSTQQSSVNNSFTPPGAPSPQKQQEQQQPFILSTDIYPSAPSSASQNPTNISPTSTSYFTNPNPNQNPSSSNQTQNPTPTSSFPPTFSTPQEQLVDPSVMANPFATYGTLHYTPSSADAVIHGGNMSQTAIGGGGGDGGGGSSRMGIDDGNWEQLLSSMGWNEWQQGTG